MYQLHDLPTDASTSRHMPHEQPAHPHRSDRGGCEQDEIKMPPSAMPEMADGFIPHMIRTVINGRDDEVVDLAKISLWH